MNTKNSLTILQGKIYNISEIDKRYIKELSGNNSSIFSLNKLELTSYILNVYSYHKLNLTEILPFIKNLYFKVIEEKENIIQLQNKSKIYLNQFLLYTESSLKDQVISEIEATLMKINNNNLIDDELNSLITLAGLNYKKIEVIRALVHYF